MSITAIDKGKRRASENDGRVPAMDEYSEEELARLKQLHFQQLKAICVPLLNETRQPPSSSTTSRILALLAQLSSHLPTIPNVVLTPQLANYIFFPLSPLLQPSTLHKSDAVLEAVFRALAALVKPWRRAVPDPMRDEVRNELWIMVALRLGGPLDPNTVGMKKKADGEETMMDESKEAAIRLLIALMDEVPTSTAASAPSPSTVDEDDDPLGEHIDWTKDEPFDQPPSACAQPRRPPTPPVPILFHTLTTLLALSSTPTSHATLQLSSLAALQVLISGYLVYPPPTPASPAGPSSTATAPSIPAALKPGHGPSPLLATALPGTVSTLTRIALSLPTTSRRQPAPVVAKSLSVLSVLLVAALADSVTTALRPHLPSLETLSAVASSQNGDEEGISESPETSSPQTLTGPTVPTSGWLSHTLASLFLVLSPLLSSLPSHPARSVQFALVSLASDFLSAAPSLPLDLKSSLLSALFMLSSSAWPNVQEHARACLLPLLVLHQNAAISLIQSKLSSLPRLMKRKATSDVEATTKILKEALQLLLPSTLAVSSLHLGTGVLLGKAGLNERWALGLVTGLEESATSRNRITSDPDTEVASGTSANDEGGVGSFVEELGKWAAASSQEREVVDLFLNSGGGIGKWSVLDRLVRGFSSSAVEGGAAGKKGRKVVKEIVAVVLEELERERDSGGGGVKGKESEVGRIGGTAHDEEMALVEGGTGPVTIVEHTSGLTPIPALTSLKPVVAQKPPRLDPSPLLLQLLSTSSTALGSSFRPLLLRSLYPLLQPTPEARQALSIVAHSTGYASTTNLVRANADYALNAVARRLGAARLDPSAPGVLGELVRVGGSDVVRLMGDVVEDVWDALDDYHGYESVAVGLWGVLEALMSDVVEPGLVPALQVGEGDSPGERDWKRFVDWFEVVRKGDDLDGDEDDEDDGMPKSNPEVPFGEARPKGEGEEDGDPTEGDGDGEGFPQSSDPEPLPPSPTQALAIQILSKATYFLSHESPVLRARVLLLMSASVASFATSDDPQRHGHYLPAIHRAWPFVTPRLAVTEDPAVVRAALKLIATLSTYAGEFMGRRILDDVWPRLKVLLDVPVTSAVQGKYAEHHRSTVGLLSTLERIAAGVPLKEDVLWDLAVRCRRFLVPSSEARPIALKLYRALIEVNAEAVWVCLEGTVEAGRGEGNMKWLVVDGEEQVPSSVLLELF